MKFKNRISKNIIIPVFSVISVVAIFTVILFQSRNQYKESYFYSMDTYVEIIGDNDVKEDVKQIFSDTEKIFDNYTEKSEVSNLNLLGTMSVSDELLDALTQITQLNKTYGNSADITIGKITELWNITGKNPAVPSRKQIADALKTVGFENIKINGSTVTLKNGTQLDFGSVAKGIALDYVKEHLDKKAANKSIVSAGSSSILLYGDNTFTTSVLSPDSDGILGKLHTDSGFISTSGGYHRYSVIDGVQYMHIFDTKTGQPSETDFTSVTVYCQNGLDSDFLSTMIFADGTEKLRKYLENDNFKIVAVDKDKNVYVSEGLDFELTDDSYKLCAEQSASEN